MSTTLRWLIESSSLENLHCVACSDKLDTPISSVNVLDNLDVVKWIKPNELVLSSGYLFMDDESLQRQLVQELHQVGCSALGIKTRRFFQTRKRNGWDCRCWNCPFSIPFPISAAWSFSGFFYRAPIAHAANSGC